MVKGKLIPLLILNVLLSNCSLDKPKYAENVVKDFNLGWWSDGRYTALFLNNDHTEYGGREVVPEKVVEIGFNEDFIVAKQHPNIYKEIESRILKNETDLGYKLENPADTLYLPMEFILNQGGEFYLKKEGARNLDYLFPYEKITYYYIIDIHDYRLRFWATEGHVFRYDNEADYLLNRKKLGIPDEVQLNPVDISKGVE